jgi:protein SCO1/2
MSMRAQTSMARLASTVAIVLFAVAVSSRMSLANVATEWDEASALRYSQAAIGRALGDHKFRDTRSSLTSLRDFRGKPLVINLIYTSCYHTCPVIIQTLARAVDIARDALGAKSFTVVTIGFDTRADTPTRMRAYGESQGVDLSEWRFLSADDATIDALSKDLGFVFYPSPRGFDHLAQTSIIDENGVVYRQVYGATFEPPAVVEPLKALVFGRKGNLVSIDGLLNRIKLFCTIYDPSGQRYRFDYGIFVGGTIGLLSLFLLAGVIVREWRRGRFARGGV